MQWDIRRRIVMDCKVTARTRASSSRPDAQARYIALYTIHVCEGGEQPQLPHNVIAIQLDGDNITDMNRVTRWQMSL